jgi:GTP-binding protein HflX
MERSIVVGFFDSRVKEFEVTQIMEELQLLTESAGGEVLEQFSQKRAGMDKKYLIGKGKVEEIKEFISEHDVEAVIFYNSLSNIQQRNLERDLKVKVVDRTRLILDVFATRARTLEGKLQVELAQLLYLLPRLTGRGIELSRLGGGIGTRGPGETRLEVDRRTIKKRISIINNRLDKVIKSRELHRQGRALYPVPVVSLVGYTSAGKSTLFHSLTGQEVVTSKQLFSTLDPLLRRVELGDVEEGYYFLLSDTVGFIRDMPKELFRSFRATLEEMGDSDLILHVVDISSPDYLNQRKEVEKVLRDMKVPDQKIITVYNKIDLLEEPPEWEEGAAEGGAYVSAKEKTGLLDLKKVIFQKYFSDYRKYHLSFPFNAVNIDAVNRWAIILKKGQKNGNMTMEILCSRENMLKFKEKHGGFVK